MNRKLIALIAMVALAATGAFAQFSLGVSAAAYSNAAKLSADGFAQAWDDVKHGGGYLGFFAEVGMDNLAIGASVNATTYTENFGIIGNDYEMINVDGNLYAQGHLFGYHAFLDPFLEAGAGRLSMDYRNAAEDPDTDNPLLASYYWDVGGGLGVNIGSVGIFLKGLYNIPFADPATGQLAGGGGSYPLAAYPVSNLKFIFGAKIIF
jgi:hypothetical protein